MFVACLWSLVSAILMACGVVLQHREARRQPGDLALSPSLIVRLLARPLWLAGGGLDLLGVGANALALRAGPVAIVQAVKTSSVAIALLISAGSRMTRLRRVDILSIAILVAGTTTFIVTAQPAGGDPPRGAARWLLAGAIVVLVVVAALVIAERRSGRAHSIALGVATGAVWALTTLLLKTTVTAVTRDGVRVLGSWSLWALLVGATLGTVINQSAFKSGDLVWSLPAMSVVEPILAIGLGRLVFREQFHAASATSWVLIAIGAAAALTAVFYLGHHQAEPEVALGDEIRPGHAE